MGKLIFVRGFWSDRDWEKLREAQMDLELEGMPNDDLDMDQAKIEDMKKRILEDIKGWKLFAWLKDFEKN